MGKKLGSPSAELRGFLNCLISHIFKVSSPMKQKRQRLAIKNSSQELTQVREFHSLIQRGEQNYVIDASKMGTIWNFFLSKWLRQCNVEKFNMQHSSLPETSPQWLNFIMAIPPIKNHYPQWNQIPQSLIYSVSVSIDA